MYTDLHSHVIWGVDDGAKTEEQTQKMLQAAVRDQIGTIIATPHITPGIDPFPEEKFEAHVQAAREYIRREGLPLTLYTGAEIFYTEYTVRMLREGRVRTLAGSYYTLVEFNPDEAYSEIAGALRKVASAGFIPVLAHVERYMKIHNIRQIRDLRENCRTLMQVNASTLLRKPPLFRKGYMEHLFREGLVDLISTDVHAMPGRESKMTQGMEKKKKKYGEGLLRQVMENADMILSESKRV